MLGSDKSYLHIVTVGEKIAALPWHQHRAFRLRADTNWATKPHGWLPSDLSPYTSTVTVLLPGEVTLNTVCFRCCCCGDCCKKGSSDYDLDDNCCQCNVVALKKLSGLPDLDLVYVTYHVDVSLQKETFIFSHIHTLILFSVFISQIQFFVKICHAENRKKMFNMEWRGGKVIS